MIELKPCPACGSDAIITGCGGVRAICKNWDCQMTGPRKMDRDDAAAAWNALPRHLRWTKEPPTDPGWYFCQRICPGAPKHYPLRVVHIHYDVVMGKRTLCYGGCAWYGVEDDRQESSPLCDISKSALEEMWWAGPIQEPVEKL